MGFFDEMADAWARLAEESKKNSALRQQMISHAKEARDVPKGVINQEQRLCSVAGVSGFDWHGSTQSPKGRAGETIFEILKPSASDLVAGVPGKILAILGAIDAANTGLLKNEIDKMGPIEAQKAYKEVEGIIVALDTVIGGFRSRIRQLESEKFRQYRLWRTTGGDSSREGTDIFFRQYHERNKIRDVANTLLCLSARREKLTAIRSQLANAGLQPLT